jgi:hypothetical protein
MKELTREPITFKEWIVRDGKLIARYEMEVSEDNSIALALGLSFGKLQLVDEGVK